MPVSDRLKWYLRALVGVVLALVAAEGIFHIEPIVRVFSFRYREYFVDNTPPWPVSDRWREDHPLTQINMRPHWKGDFVYAHGTVHFETNRDGFAFADLPYEKPPGTIRIAFYGNSVLLSKEIPAEASVPNRVQALLRAQGYDVECLNFAVDNTELQHWIMYHRYFGLKYDPDAIVILTPRGEAPPEAFEEQDGKLRLVTKLEPKRYNFLKELRYRLGTQSRLYVVGRRVISEFRHSHRPLDALLQNWRSPESAVAVREWTPETIHRDAARQLELMRLFTEEAAQQGISQVFTMWVKSPVAWNSTGQDDAQMAEMERLVQQNGSPHPNLTPIFAQHALDGRPESDWYLPRYNHFHEKGTAEAARLLVEVLKPKLTRRDESAVAPH